MQGGGGASMLDADLRAWAWWQFLELPLYWGFIRRNYGADTQFVEALRCALRGSRRAMFSCCTTKNR
jgi:hypothetical protein